jgi:hypothetical protein
MSGFHGYRRVNGHGYVHGDAHGQALGQAHGQTDARRSRLTARIS